MYLQDGLSSSHVRVVQGNASVEAAWAQQGRIEDVGAVRRCENDDVDARVETVHFDEDLIQGLLALVVAAAEACAAVPAYCIDLIDEHDTWGVALGLLEQVADARRADAHEHFHELRAAD